MVSRACVKLLGTPARTGKPLKIGSRTAVYRAVLHDGRSVIVKLYAHTARRNAFTEATAIRAAEAAVPVPKVLGCGTTSGEGATALVMTDLGTITLGDAVRSDYVPHAQALRDLGGLLARLHRASIASSMPRHPLFEPVSSLSRRCPPDLLSEIAPALAVIADTPDSAPTAWCHGDLHFDNVVLSGPKGMHHFRVPRKERTSR
ncbi:aminoglycoside phosphotransferase family protein [Streptomyces sp. NBC_01363]|uniref:aminoglycoside phosphotransferase family protein n=1 Tax=Streptomyces sp. NBC_01363 TaxID=2903840 RepID=UPI00224DB8FF|nr:aminoglycoside phosphotransferase family protein [Streptomyces sp. NBC_01363]MCX4734960.1 aminoglycoside phosphotransferase family protein [Streptomyces sp. NBC_01363]